MGLPRPANEIDRVIALAKYDIFETPPESGFDAMAQLAARMCGMPISVVSIVGAAQQWAKASVGIPQGSSNPREDAFCSRAILAEELLEIGDLSSDPRFAQNPLVAKDPNFRFYAGVPLVDHDGFALGTLCVIDREPRTLSDEQRTNLTLLAKATMELIAARASMPRSERARVEALAAAVEFAAEPIIIHAPPNSGGAATITYVNAAFTNVFGFPRAEIVGQRMRALYGPATDPNVTANLRKKVEAGEAVDASIALYDRDGTMHDVELHTRPVAGENGVTSCWVVTLRDVTEERRVARELARQAERTRVLYAIASSQGSDALALIDAALEVGMTNLAMTTAFVASIDAGTMTIVNSVGADAFGPVGTTVAYAGTAFETAFESQSAIASEDEGAPVRSMLVAPLAVAGARYGVIGFATHAARSEPMTALDRDFVRLISALIGSARERASQRERLDALAFHDALTGLPNRSLLADRLERAIASSARTGATFAIHYVDLDGFKAINDRGGHGLGDAVLREAAARLGNVVRDGDTVARVGGDEFVLLQADVQSREDAAHFADRLVGAMRAPIAGTLDDLPVRASVGVARFPSDGFTADELLARADEALYAAKRAGKDRVAFADESR